tara:strand:+ start:639 stop:1280 length:642 start_codon:yes stop_codon:yes gene_type:complete
MKITKFGQCCLLIEIDGKRVLTDPGRFSTSQNEVENIDLILITHEHGDHLHTESIQAILGKNPNAKVVTNTAVGKLLTDLNVAFEVLEGRESEEHAGVTVEAFEGKHVEIFEEYGQVQNTGYFIGNKLFYPGDAYTNPEKEVPVLALPVAGPWCKAADAIRYALEVKPKAAFPVHDAVLSEAGMTLVHGLFDAQLTEHNIKFTKLRADESAEF